MARAWGALADAAEQRSHSWAPGSELEECPVLRPSAEPRPRLASSDVQAASLQLNLPSRLGPVVLIQITLSLVLLTKALAVEQSSGNQDQVESHSDSLLKFDEKFKAVVDMKKHSKKASFGPLSVTTSYTTSKTLIGTAPATETRHDQTVAFDLANAGNGNGEALPPLFWALSPSAVYANSFVKEGSHQMLADGLPDQTTGVSSGASWTWNGGNAALSYWNYNLVSHYLG